ncbi:MAG: Crp/Fnr family transcriptional regulator [Pseudomonadales bacterium]|nr:Crp/Fnr family transcriptional regulator [Pseudomonadales bacterium]
MTNAIQHRDVWSSPCLLGQPDAHLLTPEPAGRELALVNSLSRVFGIHLKSAGRDTDHPMLSNLARLFHRVTVDADTALERHQEAWSNVYLIQHGVTRLFREAPNGKISIHHFFAEGDLVWPVFGRSRTMRNTLCLSTVTHCTLWAADFQAFRATIRKHSEGQWARFALALTEELAELATMREFHKQTLSAKERYDLLVRDYPELVQRVPDNQLAAWLGVVPATFSRLKRAS